MPCPAQRASGGGGGGDAQGDISIVSGFWKASCASTGSSCTPAQPSRQTAGPTRNASAFSGSAVAPQSAQARRGASPNTRRTRRSALRPPRAVGELRPPSPPLAPPLPLPPRPAPLACASCISLVASKGPALITFRPPPSFATSIFSCGSGQKRAPRRQQRRRSWPTAAGPCCVSCPGAPGAPAEPAMHGCCAGRAQRQQHAECGSSGGAGLRRRCACADARGDGPCVPDRAATAAVTGWHRRR